MIHYREESQGVLSIRLYDLAECRAIVERTRDLTSWKAALVRDARDATNYEVLHRADVRSARTLHTAETDHVYREFEARMDATLKPLIKEHWKIELSGHSGTHLLRYGTADHYVPHHDTGPGFEDRYFSVVCYLNDDFTGGQTSFPGLNFVATPEPGKAIVFPSDYLHCSEPVISGEKFVLVSWINGPAPIKWI
jgi:predicted 2-oxoglutarate/Fe(II)-dependent dioxygenase YbiX